MITLRRARLAAVLAGCLVLAGALAAFGSASALAYTQIYGSGAALQNQLQTNILIPGTNFGSVVTFTQTTSGGGSKEFGNTSGKLEPKEDKEAEKAGQLDAYVAVDSSPTTTELANASSASGESLNEIPVPVAQTPLDILLSLPADLKLNSSSQKIDITNELLSELFAGTVPSTSSPSYSANTWGAFLIDAGLSASDFTDTGGGSTTISIEVRKSGAGTTLNLKQYLFYVDAQLGLKEWEKPAVEENETACETGNWPTTATILPCNSGNGTDSEEVTAVSKNAGTIGYATAGDAASGGFASEFKTGGASQQILYAQVEDNLLEEERGKPAPAQFADPENGSQANVYAGSAIQVNSSGSGVGNWIVPNTSGTFDPTGSWAGTRASDPAVYGDAGEGKAYYPIVAVAFDLSWKDFAASKLASEAKYTEDAAGTAAELLEYATSGGGQEAILESGADYYAPLPTGGSGLANIQEDAQLAAATVGITAVGGGTGKPLIGSSSSLYNFGSVVLPGSATVDLVFTNKGLGAWTPGDAELLLNTAGAFKIITDECSLKTITAGKTCLIEIEFQPPNDIKYLATLMVPGGPLVGLEGEGT